MVKILEDITEEISKSKVNEDLINQYNEAVIDGIKKSYGLNGLWFELTLDLNNHDSYSTVWMSDYTTKSFMLSCSLNKTKTDKPIEPRKFYQLLMEFKRGTRKLYFDDTKKYYTDFKEFKRDYLTLKLANVTGG